jgi:hypothetical protein
VEKPKLVIEVWDWKNLQPSDFVGRAVISSIFVAARAGRKIECWVQLKRRGVKITGAVHLVFHIGNFTPDPYVLYFCFQNYLLYLTMDQDIYHHFG